MGACSKLSADRHPVTCQKQGSSLASTHERHAGAARHQQQACIDFQEAASACGLPQAACRLERGRRGAASLLGNRMTSPDSRSHVVLAVASSHTSRWGTGWQAGGVPFRLVHTHLCPAKALAKELQVWSAIR